MTNLVPAITFVMAVIFRMERLGINAISGQAKVLGTLVGIGGAMFLTFYEGIAVDLWSSKLHLIGLRGPNWTAPNRVVGSLLAVGSCFSYAIWLIIQEAMMKGTLEHARELNLDLKAYLSNAYIHPMFKSEDDDDMSVDDVSKFDNVLVPTKRQPRRNTPIHSKFDSPPVSLPDHTPQEQLS